MITIDLTEYFAFDYSDKTALNKLKTALSIPDINDRIESIVRICGNMEVNKFIEYMDKLSYCPSILGLKNYHYILDNGIKLNKKTYTQEYKCSVCWYNALLESGRLFDFKNPGGI